MVAQTASGATTALPRRSLGGLIAISIFWFALNFHWTALLFIVIPDQVQGLLLHEATGATLAAQAAFVRAQKDLVLGIVVAPGLIVALIANPLFGLLSDRTTSRFGRRKPYVLGGTLLNVAGLLFMAVVPSVVGGHTGAALAPSILALIVGLMLTQFANNSAAAPFHALLPDLVPQEQLGTASGIMGLAQLFGTIGGFLMPSLVGFDVTKVLEGSQSLSTFNSGIAMAYYIVAAVIVVMALLTALTVREKPMSRPSASDASDVTGGRTWRDLIVTVVALIAVTGGCIALLQARIGIALDKYSVSGIELIVVLVAGFGAARAFDFRPRRSLDFTWVVVTRMLVMIGINLVSLYLLYYMQDVAKAPSAETATTQFGIILTITATVSTFFAGAASDRFGKKRMVYLSGALMAVVGAAFILAPYLLPGHVLMAAYIAGAVYGLGYGAYISVDWALVAAVLPSGKTFARDMGIWNIGVTIPQVFAAVFGGWMLTLGLALGSQLFGYSLIFGSFVVFCVAGTVTVRYIRGTR